MGRRGAAPPASGCCQYVETLYIDESSPVWRGILIEDSEQGQNDGSICPISPTLHRKYADHGLAAALLQVLCVLGAFVCRGGCNRVFASNPDTKEKLYYGKHDENAIGATTIRAGHQDANCMGGSRATSLHLSESEGIPWRMQHSAARRNATQRDAAQRSMAHTLA